MVATWVEIILKRQARWWKLAVACMISMVIIEARVQQLAAAPSSFLHVSGNLWDAIFSVIGFPELIVLVWVSLFLFLTYSPLFASGLTLLMTRANRWSWWWSQTIAVAIQAMAFTALIICITVGEGLSSLPWSWSWSALSRQNPARALAEFQVLYSSPLHVGPLAIAGVSAFVFFVGLWTLGMMAKVLRFWLPWDILGYIVAFMVSMAGWTLSVYGASAVGPWIPGTSFAIEEPFIQHVPILANMIYGIILGAGVTLLGHHMARTRDWPQ